MNINVLTSRLRLAPLLIVALAMTGCGSNVKITGKVSKGGQPVNPVKGMHMTVGFHPLAEADSAKPKGPDLYAANVQDDGSFDVPGIDGDGDGNGIPPGKYRVSVVVSTGRDRSGTKKKGNIDTSDKDLLDGAFGPDNSPIIRDLKSSTYLEIDLDKPTG